MLKNLATILCLLALSPLAQSEPVALRFDRLPIVEAARLIYGQIDKESYILSPDFDASESVVTLDLLADSPSKAKSLFERYLRDSGFAVQRESGVVFLRKSLKAEQPKFFRTYFPKYQAADSLRRLVDSALGRQQQGGNLMDSNTEASPTSALGQSQSVSDVLIFSGSQNDVTAFDLLVDLLDVPIQQIHVSAAVIEVSKSHANQSALQVLADFFNSNLRLDVVPSGLPFSLSLGAGGLSAAISLLDTDSRFSLISSPSVVVQSGEVAKVEIGSEVPVLASTTTTDGGNQTQSIEYRSAGVIFEVEPTVRREGIYIKISQTLSDFVRTDTGVNNSPTLLKRSVNSKVQVKEGDLLLFAGLNESVSAQSSARFTLFPFPVSDSDSKNLREIVVLLEVKKI
jgi:type II secretory pathway component GspD/PulD (secretin)